MEELKDLEKMPKEARTVLVLELIQKILKESRLSWIDISNQLKSSQCPLCSSFIRICPNCSSPVSIGHRGKCMHCGFSLEKIEIEPDKR